MNQYLKLYEKSNNPLENNEILEKVIKAYISYKKNVSTTFYNEIEKAGTERKKSTPPPMMEKDTFWSVLFNKWKRNILNNIGKINPEKYQGHFEELVKNLKEIPDITSYHELCNIVKNHPIVSKYGIMPSGDRLWNFVLSRNISGRKDNDINPNYRLYINSEASDTYQIVAGFISKCSKQNLPYYLKFIEVPEDYQDRADSIVIWADEKTLFKYITILNDLKEEVPNIISRCNEPPLLTMRINDWIGFGEEPNEGSYTSARIKLLKNSIDNAITKWIIENQDKRLTFGKSNFSIKEYITAKSVKEEFDIIKREIMRNPKCSIRYGLEINDLNSDLYIELCNDLVSQVIPNIKDNNYQIPYNKNGKKMFFNFNESIYEVLDMIVRSDTEKNDIFEKIRGNIKANSKQYGIDAEKFIFNDDYLERIKKTEEKERK